MTQQDPRRFYVYAYLRSKDSEHGKKLTPYYIGKGKGKRAFSTSRRVAPRPGDTNFVVFVQEGLTEEEAFALEKYCIKLYGRLDTGTGILRNLTDGGEGASGSVASEDTRRKLSKALLGNRRRFGKPHTQEAKDKVSRSLLGNRRSVGRLHTQETKDKMSLSRIGKNHTQESRMKMSQSRLKYLYELIDPAGEVYVTDNLKDFAKQYGLHQSALQQMVNGKRNHHQAWTGRIVETLR
jgi:group I intron endonuclease